MTCQGCGPDEAVRLAALRRAERRQRRSHSSASILLGLLFLGVVLGATYYAIAYATGLAVDWLLGG